MMGFRALGALIFLICCQSIPATGQDSEIYSKDGVAILGYDAVAFFTDKESKKGNDLYTYDWKNATWWFTSEENKSLFSANPEKYAPQFGGYCAWGMREGYKAETSPKNAWTVHKDKLYLNYNKNTSKGWREAKETNIELANQNWLQMTHQ